MEAGAGRLLYRNAGVVLVRATTWPDGLDLPDCPDLSGGARVEQGCAWLARAWALEDVRDAVEVASPVLAGQVREVCAGRRPPARHVRRMVTSMTSYLRRWAGRATPFGLFAGVALADVGGDLVVRWGGRRRVVARPDADWLGQVITKLERHPELLERLPVVVNSTAFERGDRLVVPGAPQDRGHGDLAPAEVSVRRTPAVSAAANIARSPIGFGRLVQRLAGDYPTTSKAQIADMVSELVARRVLLTSLWPPMTVTDALGHVLAQLAAAGGNELPAVAPLARDLCEVHRELSRHNPACRPTRVGRSGPRRPSA
jgi:hypothetical protein